VKGLTILSAAWLLLGFSLALAAEQAPARLSPRTPEMSTAGKVLEVSETLLTIERTLKGKVETMVFVLEAPLPDIAVGDQLRVNYLRKDGQNVLIRLSPTGRTAVQTPKAIPGKKPAPAATPVRKRNP
jgi:hypothetical protein